MNCDEAFEALTDPQGQENSALKWHLDFCPRCREMQQVLAPALAMFSADTEPVETHTPETGANSTQRLSADFLESSAKSPSTASEPQRTLPPFLTPEAVRVAEQTAQSLHSGKRGFAAHWQRFIAVALLCVVTVWGFFYVTGDASQTANQPQHEPVMLADQCLWTNRHNPQITRSAEESSSRWVVLSCVSCHLENSLE